MELGDWSGGGTPSKAKSQYWQGGTIPWVSPKDMKTERISDSEDHITKEAVSHSATSLINAGSVLIVTRSGILRHTLPVAVNLVPVTVKQDLKALTPRNNILAEYVAWALRSFSRDILHACSKQGTTVNSVETSKLLGFEIPVAPRGQQAKIVSEIEKQFSRLDKAVANLKRVKANLKRYKAAVLKAAVEGKLTEDWRKQHPNVEPASKLLERILAARRAKWKGKGIYKEPAVPVTSDLASLPKEWTWAGLEQLTSAVRVICYGILMPKDNIPNGTLYVKVKDLKGDRVDLASLHRTSPKIAAAYARVSLKSGDLLLAIRGTYGRVAEVPPELDGANITQDTARLDVTPFADHCYVAAHLLSEVSQAFFRRVARGVAVKGVNIGDVRLTPVSLPPVTEQNQIVVEVERRLSIIDNLKAAVQANLARAEHLRQSILGQAFSGKLLFNGSHG